MATKPTLEEVRTAIERHRAGFAALAARRPADGPAPEQAVLVAFDLALACFDNPWAIHGTTKKLVCDLVPGDNVLILNQDSQRLVWRTVADTGVTREYTTAYDIPLTVFRVHWTDADAFLDVVSDDMAVTVDAATAYHAAYTHRLSEHVTEGLAAVQHAMDTTADAFGQLPDDWCCRGECCGPGSWCCGRAGTHAHTAVVAGRVFIHRPDGES